MQDNTAFRASIYVIYVVLLICVCNLYAGIPASRVVRPTGIPSSRRTGTRRMSGDTNMVFPIGIRGKGAERMYPLGRLPTHPRRALGAASLGKNLWELFCVDTMDVLPYDACRQFFCSNMLIFCVLGPIVHQTLLE